MPLTGQAQAASDGQVDRRCSEHAEMWGCIRHGQHYRPRVAAVNINSTKALVRNDGSPALPRIVKRSTLRAVAA